MTTEHLQPLDLDPLLEQHAGALIAQGWRIESKVPGQIVLVRGKPINHILHLLLSIITLGLWLLVWLLVGLTGGEKRKRLFIGQDGTVWERKVIG